jgi:hypothetical protein
MADLFTDLLIYTAIGIMTFAIGLIIGYYLLMRHYTRRFLVLARDCTEAESVIPLVDELARET